MDKSREVYLISAMLVIALFSTGIYVVYFQTYFHHEYLGSTVTYGEIEIWGLQNGNFTLNFDNTTPLLYSIDVVTYDRVISYGSFHIPTNPVNLDKTIDLEIRCEVSVKSMNVTLRSDVDFLVSVHSVDNVDSHITYSNNAMFGHFFNFHYYNDGDGDLFLEVHEDCFANDTTISFQVQLPTLNETNVYLYVNLPNGYDGVLFYVDSQISASGSGWTLWPGLLHAYATYEYIGPSPDRVFSFSVRAPHIYALLLD